jgi:polyhydroxybutyrate depolymerase
VKHVAAYAAVTLVFVTAACSSSKHVTEPAPTTTTMPTCVTSLTAGTHTFEGRAYNLALPAADGKHHPMIVLFHGFGSSKDAIDADTRMDKIGSGRGYVVVTPDGSSNPRTWNFIAGASGSSADDYSFVNALLDDLEPKLCVDTTRVYATGHSAGSAFVGFLVCHKPYRFAAIANVSATIPSSCPASTTYGVLSIHGTLDPTVLYNGGLGAGQSVPIPPVKQTVANLAKRNGCAPTPVTEQAAPGVERLRYTGCPPRKNVALLSIINGGHPWPGGLQAQAMEKAIPGAQYDASNAIVDFFDNN